MDERIESLLKFEEAQHNTNVKQGRVNDNLMKMLQLHQEKLLEVIKDIGEIKARLISMEARFYDDNK